MHVHVHFRTHVFALHTTILYAQTCTETHMACPLDQKLKYFKHVCIQSVSTIGSRDHTDIFMCVSLTSISITQLYIVKAHPVFPDEEKRT